MHVLEFRIDTLYFHRFTIHIVLSPSVLAVGASFFLRYLYALPMHVWDNLHRGSNCDMFHLQWCAATSCTVCLIRYAHACFRDEHCSYVTPMHVCVFASALPALELCKSLKVNSFGRIQAGCADANLHIYIYIYEYIYMYSPVQSSLKYLIYIYTYEETYLYI